LALGAILGAAIAALFLLGVSTGTDGSAGSAENSFPLVANDVPETTAVAASVTSAVSSATVTVTTTVKATSRTRVPAVSPTSASVVMTSAPLPTTPSPTAVPTTTRHKPPRTRNPCWFIFC